MDLTEIINSLDELLVSLDELQANEEDEDRQFLLSRALDEIDAGLSLLDLASREV